MSAQPDPAVDAVPGGLETAFRQTMSGVVSPVAVVTTVNAGRVHGSTVSAWMSLSMDPPMVVVSLDQRSRLLAQLRESGRFGVNVLASDQAGVAATFASKDHDKFGLLGWALDDGLPRLAGAAGWLACDISELTPGGDHVLVLGRVVAAEAMGLVPLAYHARRFGTHTPLAPPGS